MFHEELDSSQRLDQDTNWSPEANKVTNLVQDYNSFGKSETPSASCRYKHKKKEYVNLFMIRGGLNKLLLNNLY
jgi:hypothetical protein